MYCIINNLPGTDASSPICSHRYFYYEYNITTMTLDCQPKIRNQHYQKITIGHNHNIGKAKALA